jgi:hypothetical protein
MSGADFRCIEKNYMPSPHPASRRSCLQAACRSSGRWDLRRMAGGANEPGRPGARLFHPRFERTAPPWVQIQHVPERIEQVVVAVMLARLGWYVRKFATPKMPDHVALLKHRHVPFLTGVEILLHTDGGRQGLGAEIIAVMGVPARRQDGASCDPLPRRGRVAEATWRRARV